MMDIDIVVLWVDGNDPAWQTEKAKYQEAKTTDANAVNRFRDWGLMKYWFRGIEAFAPWVRTIHFVTWGHVPDFLKLDHPKLHLVRHGDYLPKDCLPTFNSCAIEMSIHQIPGLSEHFLYANDDTFFIRPVKPETFFHDGLPVAEGCEAVIPPVGKLMAWYAILCNCLGIINQHFPKKEAVAKNRKKYINRAYGLKDNIRTFLMERLYRNRFVGLAFAHSVSAFKKQAFRELWDAEPELLKETTMHKFRTYTDVSQWAAVWWQIASGQFVPGKVDNVRCAADTWATDSICETIKSQAHDMICINDPDDPTDFETNSQKIQAAFEQILPEKCSFEK